MHITVGIPSRGRPLELAAAVLALEHPLSQSRVQMGGVPWKPFHQLSGEAAPHFKIPQDYPLSDL